MKSIVHIPNDVLTTPAKTVTHFDKKLENLIKDMTRTLKATKKPKGVGLAAPQIGEPYRVFITKPTPSSDIRTFINPEIISVSQDNNENGSLIEKDNRLEGCLSIPNIWGHVTRAKSIVIRYQDNTGATHEEAIDEFLATIVQHETDHTNGILFSQRVIEQHGKFFKSSIDEHGKEILEEISL